MEKIRILLAACCLLAAAVSVWAQDSIPDSLKNSELVTPDSARGDEKIETDDPTARDKKPRLDPLDKKRILTDTLDIWETEIESSPETTITVIESSIYDENLYLSRGVGDEFKPFAGLPIVTHGIVGAPKIPVEYLNVAGTEIRLNGLPFAYNGLYRPYIIGTDLDVLPWEILNQIEIKNGYADLSLRRPGGQSGSDVEVFRGAYGYGGTRWRFYQPLGSKTKGYFTLGFKKADPFYTNSNYDGYHVAGGIERKLMGGVLNIDIWKYRAKAGLLSFDFIVNQLDRHSRGIDRTELTYSREITPPLSFKATGLYHRSAQTITGYAGEFKTKNDIAGAKGELQYKNDSLSVELSSAYYNSSLYDHPGVTPSVNIYEHQARIDGRWNKIGYKAELGYNWAGIDHAAILPSAEFKYDFKDRLFTALSFYRQRRSPDLYLLYYDDYVVNLGSSDLDSYHFLPSSTLKSPLTTAVSLKLGWGISTIDIYAGLTIKDIKDQIRLAYYLPGQGEYILSPVNFDDRMTVIDAGIKGGYGPLQAELSAAYRIWNEKYFDDGLEKGPAVLGFGRLTMEKQFFIPDLYLGGSIEAQASSRRDYRTMQIGLTDGFIIFEGRVVVRYKDFTFHLNEDNLTAAEYFPLYPYPGTPRSVWWGFKWEFVN